MPLLTVNRTQQPYRKTVALEPIPGYTLIEPLGRGGFGEVWRCEAPGGLHKAIKFVFGKGETSNIPSNEVRQEYQAFQQVKAIRHPFLLSVERLDLIGSDLMIVMELADSQLADRFHECAAQGQSGIHREELTGYLLEAAEALDLLSAKHGLQHMDVKPANLFVTGGHMQVGDYGLVSKLEVGRYCLGNRGHTVEYAAPEAHQGKISSRSDQYSLALVYYQLLTGAFPFSCNTPKEIVEQHLTAAPDLSRLPERDWSPVGRALSKQPDDRFPSCLAFVRALTTAVAPSPVNPSRLALITPSKMRPSVPDQPSKEAVAPQPTVRELRVGAPVKLDPQTPPKTSPPLASPAGSHCGTRLIIGGSPVTPAAQSNGSDTPAALPNVGVNTPLPASPSTEETQGPFPFKLEMIRSLFPVEHLLGRPCKEPSCSAEELIRKVVLAAEAAQKKVSKLGRVIKLPDGTWTCRFLSSIDPRVAQVKLNLLRDETGATIESPNPGRVVFRRPYLVPVKSSLFGIPSMKELNFGLEVEVHLPEPGRGTAEVLTTGRLYGGPPADFREVARPAIVKLMQEIREQLSNIEERRQFPRFPATFPVNIFPLHSDGRPEAPTAGRCMDVSESGLAIISLSKPATRHVYVEFEGVAGIEGLAILVQIIRVEDRTKELVVCGRYRLDFGSEEPVK